MPNIAVLVLLDFFTSHYIFRWRTAMNAYYMAFWPDIRSTEGAAQRVQEDTMRFASTLEDLGTSFFSSLITLVVFLPILWNLSPHITQLPIRRRRAWQPGLGGAAGGAGGYAAAGGGRREAAGPQLPEPAGRGGLPQGAGLWRGQCRPRRPPDRRASCSATCGATISASTSTTPTSTWPGTSTSTSSAMYRCWPWHRRSWRGPSRSASTSRCRTPSTRSLRSFQFFARAWSTIVELLSIRKRLVMFEAEIPRDDALTLAPGRGDGAALSGRRWPNKKAAPRGGLLIQAMPDFDQRE